MERGGLSASACVARRVLTVIVVVLIVVSTRLVRIWLLLSWLLLLLGGLLLGGLLLCWLGLSSNADVLRVGNPFLHERILFLGNGFK